MAAPLTKGVSHVGLTVSKLEESVCFFEAFGYKRVGGDKDYPSVFISDNASFMTLWEAKTDSPVSFDRKKNLGLHHLAINVPSEQALNDVHKKLLTMPNVKIEFGPQASGPTMKHAMCYEPSGLRIEFTFHC